MNANNMLNLKQLTKLEKTILYIMTISIDLTKSRLHKCLYFIAQDSIEYNYKPFFEAKFIKNTYGPTLGNLDKILDSLENQKLSTTHHSLAYDGLTKRWHFSSRLSFEDEKQLLHTFNVDEISIISKRVNWVHGKTSNELSQITHNEYYNKINKGEEMSPYGEFPSYLLDKEEIISLLEA